jgi:hypothetical protein
MASRTADWGLLFYGVIIINVDCAWWRHVPVQLPIIVVAVYVKHNYEKIKTIKYIV